MQQSLAPVKLHLEYMVNWLSFIKWDSGFLGVIYPLLNWLSFGWFIIIISKLNIVKAKRGFSFFFWEKMWYS